MKVVLSHRCFRPEGMGGGISRLYEEIGRELRRQGCEVTVVTGEEVTTIPWGRLISLHTTDGLAFRQKLAPLLASYDFDVLECSSLGAEAIDYLGVAGRKPVVVRADIGAQDSYGQDDPAEAELLRRADAVIAISRAIGDQLLAHPGVASHVIWNGVNSQRFPFVERSPNLSLVWLGKPRHYKGYDRLHDIIKSLPDYHFDVIWGAYPDQVTLDAPNVTQHRNLDDLAQNTLYAQRSFVLSTSRFEPFGLAVLEGMSTGLVPVVPKNSGGLNEFVSDGHNGVVYESIDELPDRLAALVFERLSRAARRTAEGLSWERCVEETLGVYRQLVA